MTSLTLMASLLGTYRRFTGVIPGTNQRFSWRRPEIFIDVQDTIEKILTDKHTAPKPTDLSHAAGIRTAPLLLTLLQCHLKRTSAHLFSSYSNYFHWPSVFLMTLSLQLTFLAPALSPLTIYHNSPPSHSVARPSSRRACAARSRPCRASWSPRRAGRAARPPASCTGPAGAGSCPNVSAPGRTRERGGVRCKR